MKRKLLILEKMKKKLWKTIFFSAVFAFLCAAAVYIGRDRLFALAETTSDSKEIFNKYGGSFNIVEIVPYKGQGQWGYMVGGQEPVKARHINLAYSDSEKRQKVWNSWRDIYFSNSWQNWETDSIASKLMVTGLVPDAEKQEYTNKDAFIRDILCQDGSTFEEWKNHVTVTTVSANELHSGNAADLALIKNADLLVVQSDLTANYATGQNTLNMLQLYETYLWSDTFLNSQDNQTVDHISKVHFYSGSDWENELLPSAVSFGKTETYISYDSYVQYTEGGTKVSMDIDWDIAMAIVSRAYDDNQATIVSAGDNNTDAQFNSLDSNMDKMIYLLGGVSRTGYLSEYGGLRDLITTGYVTDPNTNISKKTGFFAGKEVWSQSEIIEYLFDQGIFLNYYSYGSYIEGVKEYVDASNSESAKNFFEYLYKGDISALYDAMKTEKFKIEEVRVFAQGLLNEDKITQTQYDKFSEFLTKLSQFRVDDKNYCVHVGLKKLGATSYTDINGDNTIRYSYGGYSGGTVAYTPELFIGNTWYLSEVYKILFASPFKPEETLRNIRVLEIEPSTAFRYNSIHKEDEGPAAALVEDDNAITQLAHYFGESWTADRITVDSVTPQQLNGMTVDLIAEYDAIYIGAEVGQISEEFRSSYTDHPYHQTGETVLTSSLYNGLVNAFWYSDITTAQSLKNSLGIELTGTLPESFLNNAAICLEVNKGTYGYPKTKTSGNDLTAYMKTRLQEFVDTGMPVILAEKVYYQVKDITADHLTQVNLYDAFAGRVSTAENSVTHVLQESSSLNNAADYLITKPTLKIQYADAGNIRKLGEKLIDSSNHPVTITRSNELSFSYSGTLPDSGDYEMLVIVDRNGDGIFDENVETFDNDDETTLENDIGTAKQNKDAGSGGNNSSVSNSTDTADTTNSQADRLFYVNLDLESEYSGNFSTTAFFGDDKLDVVHQFRVIVRKKTDHSNRMIWTGYIFPDIQTEVKILQVTGSILTDDSPRLLKKGNTLTNFFAGALAEIPESRRDYVITADQIDVMDAVTFDSSFRMTNSEDVNPLLRDYDLIIMGFDYGTESIDISGDGLECLQDYIQNGGSVIFCNNTISYVNQSKDKYYTPVKVIKADNSEEYRLTAAAGTISQNTSLLHPDKVFWNYEFSREMRDILGMDRYQVTAGSTTDKTDKQGFSNALLMDAAYKDVSSVYENGPRVSTTPMCSPVIEKLNEGSIHSYPFELSGKYSNGKMKIRPNAHAPYYQLDLERSKETDDVTVWATLGGYTSSESAYFDATAKDAVNNYYLYSKKNIYYTGYELPENTMNWSDDSNPGYKNEMRLFINTIYAALKGSVRASVTESVPIVVAREENEISQYTAASYDSSTKLYSPNVYICYYDENSYNNEKYSIDIPFRVQKTGTQAVSNVNVSAGWTTAEYPFSGLPQISTPLLSTSQQPVRLVNANVDGSLPGNHAQLADTGISADQTWSILQLEDANPDGKKLVLAVTGENDAATPLQESVYAVIVFVKRELFLLD
jgi:hypothetical protein